MARLADDERERSGGVGPDLEGREPGQVEEGHGALPVRQVDGVAGREQQQGGLAGLVGELGHVVGVQLVHRLRGAVAQAEVALPGREDQAGRAGVGEERQRLRERVGARGGQEPAREAEVVPAGHGRLDHAAGGVRAVLGQERDRSGEPDLAVGVTDLDDRGVAVAGEEHRRAGDLQRGVDPDRRLALRAVRGLGDRDVGGEVARRAQVADLLLLERHAERVEPEREAAAGPRGRTGPRARWSRTGAGRC